MLYFKSLRRQKGFTVVELLIVIVVIGILVSLVLIGYGTTQAKSRDNKRLTDAKAIELALESYRSQNTDYPPSNTTTQLGGAATGSWETSGAAQPGTFLNHPTGSLKNFGFNGGVPLDPINNSTTVTGNTYMYQNFPAGTNGCLASKGNYYVFIVQNLETYSSTPPQSPGFSCSGHDWSLDGKYVVGHFVNE